MKLEDLFDEKGFYKHGGFDPYRNKGMKGYDFLFNEDGNVNIEIESRLYEFADRYKVSWNSHISQMINAEQFASSTKGNYPANYMWRYL